MALEMKVLLALAPVGLVALAYALTQGDWGNAGLLVFIELLIFMCYRTEKRLQRR
jgi:hypothetical protein